jgi:hypothetical protein
MHGLVADENQQSLMLMKAEFAASRRGSTAASGDDGQQDVQVCAVLF